MATLYYTSVDRILQIEPGIGSVTDLRSADICDVFAASAEAEVNARIAKLYAVPITPAPPILQAIADDLATYRILSRRIFVQSELKNSVWPMRFREARDLLDMIAKGEIELTTASGTLVGGRTDIAVAESTSQDYFPTFTETDPVYWDQDPDKVDDLLDEREIDRA